MINRWVIAAACCCINALILGTGRLAPLMFVACLDRFHADRGRTSFPFILCYLLRTLAGPLIGYLGAKCGLKSVTIFGCLMSALGIGACFFAEDILAITILFGVVYGLGFGFGSSLVPSVLCLHFRENITVANGIAFVGSSIGGFTLPSIVDAIMNVYGVSGSFLILSAIVLNSIPCAMLLVSPDSLKQTISEKGDGITEKICQNSNSISKHEQNKENLSSQASILPKSSPEPSCYINSNTEGCVNKGFETIEEDTKSTDAKSNGLVKAIRRSSSVFEVISSTPVLIQNKNNDPTPKNMKNSNGSVKKIRRTASEFDVIPSTPVLLQYSDSDPTSKHAKNNNGLAKDVRRPSSVFEVTSGTPVLLQFSNSKRSSVLYTGESIIYPPCESQNSDGSGLGSLRIFSDPPFLVIAFIQSAFTFYVSVVWTVLIDYVRDKGIDQSKEVIFLVCTPLLDTFGRLLMGFVVDGGFMSETSFCSACFVLLSVTCCLMAWLGSFGLFLCVTLANSFISGAAIITFPGMIVNFVSDEDRTMAMASRLTMYAPMGLAASPAINFFRETRGSYDGIFYILSAVNALCCLMTYFIPHLVRRREKKKLNGTVPKLNQNA